MYRFHLRGGQAGIKGAVAAATATAVDVISVNVNVRSFLRRRRRRRSRKQLPNHAPGNLVGSSFLLQLLQRLVHSLGRIIRGTLAEAKRRGERGEKRRGGGRRRRKDNRH